MSAVMPVGPDNKPIGWSGNPLRTTSTPLAGTPTVSKATPTTSSATVLAANAARLSATLVNEGSVKVYLNFNAAATTASGFPLDVGQGMAIEGYTGDIRGITASGTGDIRVIETVAA